VAYNY